MHAKRSYIDLTFLLCLQKRQRDEANVLKSSKKNVTIIRTFPCGSSSILRDSLFNDLYLEFRARVSSSHAARKAFLFRLLLLSPAKVMIYLYTLQYILSLTIRECPRVIDSQLISVQRQLCREKWTHPAYSIDNRINVIVKLFA